MSKTRPAEIQGIAGTRRWDARRAKSILAALEEADMSVAEFARSQGVAPRRLYRWRRTLRKNDPALAFEEVAVERAVRIGELDAERIEVVLGSGRAVRVGRDFDPEALRRLLTVLGEG
jgi:transposase